MAGNLQFDVTANDRASGEFAVIAAQLKALARQLKDLDGKKAKTSVTMAGADKVAGQAQKIRADVDKLDGRKAKVSVALDAASTAPITKFSEQLRDLDGRFARANVQLSGVEAAKAKAAEFGAVLKAIPNKVATAITVEIDKGIGGRLAAVSAGVQKLGSVSQSVLPSMSQLRMASQAIVSPGSLPIVERISDAISGKFHAAVDKARVVVDKLHTGTKILEGSLLGLGAVGNATQVIGGLTAALTQLSGATVLLPGVIAGAGAALATFKVGMAGFADAVAADTPKKFKDATEDMSKSALFAVVAVRQLTSAMKGTGQIGSSVQTAMFRGISDQIYALNKTYLPVLKTGMTGIATGFNAMGREALIAVGKASSVSQVQTIFTNTSTAVGKMRLSLANAATGFLTLGAAGSTFLPRIGAAIDTAAAKFNSWSQRITSDGTFDRWAENGITAFKQLGTIVGNIGSIVGSVFSALSASGGGALASFARLTGTVKDFLNSVQGSASLNSFATTVTAAGDALSMVLGAALRAVAPLVIALGPALQTLATSIGAHLTGAIEAVTPTLTRFAELLSQNPEVLADIARAVGIAAISFGPLVAVLGIAGTLLKGMLLARIAAAAIGALGIQGTVAARVIALLATPLAALRAELPLIARGLGSLAARLLLAAGPVGALILAFSTLYATSSQFRAAVDDISATAGRILVKAFQDAGTAIASTVTMIGDILGAIQQAAGGFTSLASSVLSVSGPIGELVSGGLSGLSDLLGQLPGTALAAFAAFKVFGMIAPIFATASAAVAGFAARMLAFQGATGAGTVAANAAGAAAGRFATVLSKVGAALPLVGVAVIALGAIYGQFSSIADDVAKNVVNGTQSMSAAIEAEYQRIDKNVLFGVSSQKMMEDATNNVRGAVESQLQAMGPLDQANARVQISTKSLADEILRFGENSPQAAAAAAVLARDQANLALQQDKVASATKSTTQAMKDQADQMSAQATSMLGYEASLRQVASAQKAADDAIKGSGKNSAEAKEAVGALAQAQLDAANKAKDLAVQMGATDGGVKAFSTTLASMPRDTAAGKSAFEALSSTMSQTELDMISAAAAATGLKTEVVNLPGGKTVRVVAEADKAKAIEKLRTELQNLKDKTVTVNGDAQPLASAITTVTNQLKSSGVMVNIDGNPLPATDALNTVLSQIAQGRSFVVIDGQAVPADQALQTFLGKVGVSGGMVTINGETMPAAQALAMLLGVVNGSTATTTTDMNTGPAVAKHLGLMGSVNSSIGTMALDANPTLANGKITQTVTLGNGSKATMTYDANQTPANGKINATVTYGNGQTAIVKIDANPGPAQQAINSIQGKTVYINVVQVGVNSAVAAKGNRLAGGAIGGIVHPMADGGILAQQAVGYADGGVQLTPMRGDIAQRVPANTWRVIGDRPRGLEYFLPDDSTPRSMKIGAEWAKNRGMMLVPRSAGLATGGIRAEDGSTVNPNFYSKTNLTPSVSRLNFIADAKRLGLPTSGGLPPGWNVGPDGRITRAVQAPVRAVVRGSGAPAVNLGPLVAQNSALLGQLRALTAAVAGGGGFDATIAANTAQIAANTAATTGPAERAQSARYRSTMGALA